MKRQTVWDAFWDWAGRVPLRQKIIGIIMAPLLILGTTMAWWVSNELGGWLSYLLSEERVAQAMTVGMRGVLIITLFAAVAGLAIGYVLTWVLTRPILDMTYVARHAKNGNLSLRAPVWANDEIGELGLAFNAMISSLDTSRQNLERSNQELQYRNQELAVLHELADMTNQPYTMHQVIQHGLRHALENTGLKAGLVIIFEDKRAIIAASHNLPASYTDKALDCLSQFDFPGQRAADELLIFDDIGTVPGAPADLILESQHLGYKTLILAPILARNTTIGILAVLCDSAASLSPRSRKLLSGICNQLGVTAENSQLWEQLKQKERVRAQLLNKVVSAQEEERRRISRELHDETGQALTSLLVQLKILERTESETEIKAQVEEMRQLAVRTLQEVRRLAADLRPAALDDLGLIAALEGYVYDFARKTGIEADFLADDVTTMRLPRDVETVLYRVVQESLTNIARHAQARHVTIAIRQEEDTLYVEVTDDGHGFDVTDILSAEQRGLGLLGMQERIELLGGQFSLDSTPGSGTRIEIRLALSELASQV